MKRNYKKNRKKARSPYKTYSDYFDKVTKRNPDMYGKKYTRKEFYEWYEEAKAKGFKNPAIVVARSQRQWEYQFQRRYEKETGRKLTGKESSEEKISIFVQFVEDYYGGDFREGKRAFEALY